MGIQQDVIKLIRMPFLEEESPDPERWDTDTITDYLRNIVDQYDYPPVAALMVPAIVGVCRELVLAKADTDLPRTQRVAIVSSLLGKLGVLCSKASMSRENVTRSAKRRDGVIREKDLSDATTFTAQSDITE